MSMLPQFITIRLAGTSRVWTNCSPRLTMIGSRMWLSYGIDGMDCVLVERIENTSELESHITTLQFELSGDIDIIADMVYVNGKERRK